MKSIDKMPLMGDKGSQDKSWILKIVNARTNSIKTCRCPIESITVSSREKSDIQMSLPFIELDHIAINFEEEKVSIIGNGILPNTILNYSKNSIIRICNVFIGIQTFDETYADAKYQDTMIKAINMYKEPESILGIENRSNEASIKDFNNDLIGKIVTIINPCEIDGTSQSNVKQADKNDANFGIVGLDKIKGPDNSLCNEADNNLNRKKDDNIRSVIQNTNETKNKDKGMVFKMVNNQTMDQSERNLADNFDLYKEDPDSREADGNKLNSISDGNAEVTDAFPISNKNDFQSQIDKRAQEMVGVLEDFYKKELGDFSSIPPLQNAPMSYSSDSENRSFSPNEVSPPKQVISETKKEFEEAYHVEPPNNVLEAAIETKIEGVKDEVINVLEGDIDIPFKKQHTNDLGTIAIENEILNDAIDEIKACTPEEEGRKAEFLEAQINSFDQLRNTITDTIKEDMRESIKEIVHDEVETKLNDLKNNIEEEPTESQNKSCQLEDHAEKRTTDDDQSKIAKKAKVDDSKIKEDKIEEALSHTSDKEVLEKKSPKKLKRSDASAEKKVDSLNESAEKEKKGSDIASNKDKKKTKDGDKDRPNKEESKKTKDGDKDRPNKEESKKTKDSLKDQSNKEKSKKTKDGLKDQPSKDEPETDTKDESQKEAGRPIKKKAPAKKTKEEMPETPKKGKQAKSTKESDSPKKKKAPVKENAPEKKGRSKK